MSTPEMFTSVMTREQRNAIFSAVAVLAIGFVNITQILTASLSVEWRVNLELAAIVGVMAVAVFSLVRSIRGQVEESVWPLMIAIISAAAIRAALREEVGLPFGILAAILVAIIGVLTLPIQKTDTALLFGYFFGSLIVVFDAYVDRYWTRLPAPPEMVRAAAALAVFVFFFQVVLMVVQSRSINMGTKIANAITSFTLLITVLLGGMNIFTTQNALLKESALLGSSSIITELGASMRLATIVMGAFVTIFGSVVGVVISRALAKPLSIVANTSAQIAQGNLSARVALNREDEIGQLGAAFDQMTTEMSSLIGQLEARVADRTRDLERRALQIQTASEIGNVAANLRNPRQLLAQVTQLISERFGYYHTGIFLLDERKEFAELRAANSTGGQRMLTRGHRLKVGEVGIVGYVAGTAKPRIALDVGSDAVFFDNPDLPETRSELALPLIAGGQILGVLDVQSTEENVFSQDDISALQVLADQVAVAIENARLFEENQNALETIRRAYGDIGQAAWSKMQKAAGTQGFLSTSQGNLVRLSYSGSGRRQPMPDEPVASEDGLILSIPMKVRGQSIGAVRLSKPRNSPPWTPEEIVVVSTLTDQLSGTLESARLYQEAQLRAATERQTANIVNQIRSSTVMDGILQNTIRELGRALGATRTFINVDIPETDGSVPDGGRQA